MMKKLLINFPLFVSIISFIIGAIFLSMFIQRYLLPYNEMGLYMDSVNTVVYDSQALLAYGFLTGVFYVISLGGGLVFFIKKKKKTLS